MPMLLHSSYVQILANLYTGVMTDFEGDEHSFVKDGLSILHFSFFYKHGVYKHARLSALLASDLDENKSFTFFPPILLFFLIFLRKY